MDTERDRNMRIVLKRLAEAVIAGQPVFAVPIYFSVLTGNPPYWLSLTFAVIPLIVRWGMSRRLFTRTAFDVPILIFLAGTLLGFAIAVDKEIAAGALASTAASVLIYYGLTNNGKAGNKYWLTVGGIICIISLVFSIWFFSQGTARYVSFNIWIFKWFEWVPKTGGPVLQFNSLGALLASVIPGLAGIAFFTENRSLRTGSWILAAILLAALILSDSGGGWIAAAIGLALVLFWWHWQTVMVTAPVYGAAAGILATFYHRLNWIAPSFSTGSLTGRFSIWGNTFKLFGGIQSVTGLGLGNWSKAYRDQNNETLIHTHNSYLQLYADSGLIGLAAMVASAVQFGRISLGSLRAPRQSPWYGVAVGLTGGMIAGAAMAMYDVTTTVTVYSATSYLYMSVPFIWVWAALLVVANRKLKAI
jgi:O-antigen ligase